MPRQSARKREMQLRAAGIEDSPVPGLATRSVVPGCFLSVDTHPWTVSPFAPYELRSQLAGHPIARIVRLHTDTVHAEFYNVSQTTHSPPDCQELDQIFRTDSYLVGAVEACPPAD